MRGRESNGCLARDTAVDVRQKTVMILKGFCKPKDSLTCVEKKSLKALKANVKRTALLPARVMHCSVLLTIIRKSLPF
jgi:hypothetical protein